MADRYSKQGKQVTDPAEDAFTITTDGSLLTNFTKAVYVGEAGSLEVMMVSHDNANTKLTFTGIQAGTVLPIRIQRAYANSTANSVVGLY